MSRRNDIHITSGCASHPSLSFYNDKMGLVRKPQGYSLLTESINWNSKVGFLLLNSFRSS